METDHIVQTPSIAVQALTIFNDVWAELEAAKPGFKIPGEVVFLTGAPGAGKGTATSFIKEKFGIKGGSGVDSGFEMTNLFNTPEDQAIKASGKLVIGNPSDAIRRFLRELTKIGYNNGRSVLVDGFPRTELQCEIVKLLRSKLEESGVQTDFNVIAITCDEDTSELRQAKRRKEIEDHNAVVQATRVGELQPLRNDDTTEEGRRGRHKEYMKLTHNPITTSFIGSPVRSTVLDATGLSKTATNEALNDLINASYARRPKFAPFLAGRTPELLMN